MRGVFALLYLLRFVPHRMLRVLARGLGWLAYVLVVPRRRVGAVNLRLCFPEWTAAARRRVLRRHFFHMALLVLEYGRYWYGPAARLRAAVRYTDKHYLAAALAAGKPVGLLYPHFTAFEAALFALNQELPLASVYSHQKNVALDKQILQGRQRFDNVFLVGRTEGLRAVIRQMMRCPQAPFLYLPDQDFGARDSVFADFFGVQAATVGTLGRLAAMTGATVLPAAARRLADGSVELRFFAPWQEAAADTPEQSARRLNAFVEARVREMPEQYFWLHKRFKTRPEGEAGFYG